MIVGIGDEELVLVCIDGRSWEKSDMVRLSQRPTEQMPDP